MMPGLSLIFLFIIVCATEVACKKLREENNSVIESDENPSGKRTLIIGKLVLLPILAGVGVKFLVLLPIILSKIALLGILSFVSSNLSLLVSAIMGVRSYFFEDKSTEEDYDYDYRGKNHYDSYESSKYDNHKGLQHDGHRYRDHDYDGYEKFMHRYKEYDSLHSGDNRHYPEYKERDGYKSSKKRFRPFKLLGRIKDVIKDHFQKSKGYEKKYHNDYEHYSHDLSDDHDEYGHKTSKSRYRYSDYSIANNQPSLNNEYYKVYSVPEDWSQKNKVTISDVLEDEKEKKYSKSIASNEFGEGKLEILTEHKAGNENSNLTLVPSEYKPEENYPNAKKSFIMLRESDPHIVNSDSRIAFYATDYKITDFHNLPQKDTDE